MDFFQDIFLHQQQHFYLYHKEDTLVLKLINKVLAAYNKHNG